MGFNSRKFVAFIGTSLLVLVGAVLAAAWDKFAPQFGTFCEAIVVVLSLYLGGNIGAKFALRGKLGGLVGAGTRMTETNTKTTETNTRVNKDEDEGTVVVKDN